MKALQLFFIGIILIGLAFVVNANDVKYFEREEEEKYSFEEMPIVEQNFTDREENDSIEIEEPSKYEVDLSDLFNEIEIPSENSWDYFYDDSSSSTGDVPSKEESYDVIIN
jgi:hypothetical protein